MTDSPIPPGFLGHLMDRAARSNLHESLLKAGFDEDQSRELARACIPVRKKERIRWPTV